MKRRQFIRRSAAAVSGLTISACTPGRPAGSGAAGGGASREALGDTLDAVGGVVLPKGELGDEGVAQVLASFRDWLEAFEPVAEQPHRYIYSDEIPYGPPDPAPRWASQLEALELEAEKRFETSFAELAEEDQRGLIERHLAGARAGGLPDVGEAEHVALALLAYFYRSTEANDLCYGRAIEKRTCRGLDTASDEPKVRA